MTTTTANGAKPSVMEELLKNDSLPSIPKVGAITIGKEGEAEAAKAKWAQEVLKAKAVTEARHACDCAAKLGLCLVAELHENTLLDTSDNALRAVAEVERDNFRLTYTAGSRASGESAEVRLCKVLPHVAHVHARNFAALSPRADVPPMRAPLGQGLVDYARLADRLRSVGYEGYIAIEYAHKDGDAKKTCLAADLEYLRTL